MTDALWTAAEAAARLGRSRRTTVAVAERLSSNGDAGIQRVGHAWAATPAWWAQALGTVPRRAPRNGQAAPVCGRHSGPARPDERGGAGKKRASGVRSVDVADRTVYEKILAAHFAARKHPRLSPDEFLRGLLTPDDRMTEAYLTFDYLQGRAPEFAPFLARALAYPSEAAAEADVGAKHGQAVDTRLNWYQQTGR